MNKLKSKITRITKTLTILTILLMASITVSKAANWIPTSSNISAASGKLGHSMVTGIVPIYSEGHWIFCADRGTMLRTGQYDSSKHYLQASDFKGTTGAVKLLKVYELKSNMLQDINYQFNAAYPSQSTDRLVSTRVEGMFKYETYERITTGISNGPHPTEFDTTGLNEDEYVLCATYNASSTYAGLAKKYVSEATNSTIKQVCANIVAKLKGDNKISNTKFSNGEVDPENIVFNDDQARVGVMEDENGNPGYSRSAKKTAKNDENAYILCGAEFGYTPEDIQTAYWMQNDRRGTIQGPDNLGNNVSVNGKYLYGEALAYTKFIKDIEKNGYQASIDTANAQVFVNRNDSDRNKDEFIVGPIDINYMSAKAYENKNYPVKSSASFSNMTDLIVTTNTGKELHYKNNDFSIVVDGKTYSNGEKFPGRSQNFYIVVNAKKAEYPTKLGLGANFEYIKNCQADFYELRAKGVTYAYIGHGEPIEREIKVEGTYYRKVSTYEVKKNAHNDRIISTSTPAEISSTSEVKTMTVKAFLSQPYVDMLSADGKSTRKVLGDGQPLTELISVRVEKATATVKTTKEQEIDITMKLGGKVWCDERVGKETKLDGKYSDGEKLMSGIKVILHQKDPNGKETVYGEKYTDEKGEYLFTDLNPFNKYFVEFVYNGQYYEPTVHKATHTSDDSKGLDNVSERKAFNAKFTEIRSTPNNYKSSDGSYQEVYTRKELEDEGLIDEFGNPTEKGKNNKFVQDCMISSYTMDTVENRNIQYYPVNSKFVLANEINHANRGNLAKDSSGKLIVEYTSVYSGEYNVLKINQGYTLRQTVDLAIAKDIYNVTQTINGKTETYKYNKRQELQNNGRCWTIETRLEDAYYGVNYTRELYKEDYEYTGSEDQTLQVYVTYRLAIANLSSQIATRVTEVVDYYDQDYTVTGAYIGEYDSTKIQDARLSDTSIYPDSENGKDVPEGFKKVYITGMENILSDSDMNNEIYVFITFRVNKDNGKIILDENSEGKENVAEINGYKTYYGKGVTPPNGEYRGTDYTSGSPTQGDEAGIIDTNSKPGNVVLGNEDRAFKHDGSIVKEKLENDTDTAPYIRIIISSESRTMEGLVWEDLRTETVENTIQGNGKKDNGEPAIPNARVTLYDVNKQGAAQIYDGSKWFPAITKTDENGKYSFKGYIPGEYCVIFSYGFDEQGENGYIKYNGQDYKSTIYHSDYNENNPDDDNYWIALGQLESEKNTNYSYARDIMGNESTQGTRNYVNKYSGKDEVTNALSQKLYNTTQDTYMIAKSAKINVEIEYDRTVSDTSASGSNNRGLSNYNQSGYYNIEGINLGLQERPKAQLKVTKQVQHAEVRLSNNSILFDATGKASNVLWVDHKAHKQDQNNTYTEKDNYINKTMKEPAVREPGGKGSVQLTMDEEQMHGAQIKITYLISVANVGEVDYNTNGFYYKGQIPNDKDNTIVKTNPMTMVDYVGYQSDDDEHTTRNNIKFVASENEGWNVVSANDLASNGLISGDILDNAKKYTTILTTDSLSKDLVPIISDQNNVANKIADTVKNDPFNAVNVINNSKSVVAKTLVLTQTISADSTSDDKSYNNLTELVKVKNTAGRRMAYSVVGNQDPTKEPTEIDADSSQQVTIMPPYGQKYIYYVLGIGIVIILIAGILVVRKITKKE